MRNAMVLAVGGLLAGCVVGPNYQPPELDLPVSWPQAPALEAVDEAELAQWWRKFEDPVLDALVARALADNLELRLQAARVEAARARLGLARAEQLPTVGAQAEATRQRQPAAAVGIEGIDIPPRNLFSIAGVLGYEIDLWGRLAREREAAAAGLESNVYALEAVRLGVVADVVVGYFGLRSAQRQLDIAARTLAARAEGVRIERLRYEAGMIDELALRQAESLLATTRAELPARRDELRRRESALGILLGLAPAELLAAIELDGEGPGTAVLPERIPLELPAELLARRPDLRAVEAELVAANAGVGIAMAARLPQLNLAGLVGVTATRPGDLFDGDGQAWSVGATLAGPVFDFGRGRARVDSAEAMREQAELRYRATVALAVSEVRDALAFYDSSGARLEAVGDQVTALRRTEELAAIRYREGYIGIIELLDAQRSLLNAELAEAQARADRFAATATLFKAMGGGW